MATTNQLRLTFEIVGNDIKTLNDKIKSLVESVGSSTPDTIKETIDNQTNDIRDVVGALLIKVSQLNDQLKDMSKESTHDYSGEIQQLTTQLTSITEQINGLNTKATQLETNHTADINGLTTQIQSTNTSIGDLSNRITTIENKPESDSSIKTAYDGGAILLSGNLNKTLCVVPKNWKLLFIDWRDGNNTSWSTYTGIVINKGGFFQWRFQNCPFALQINGAGELKCYSLDGGKEAFIKSVQYQE